MQYTSIEQSKKLIELGLNPETADAWWYRSTFGVIDGWDIKWDEESSEELTLCRRNPSHEVAIVKREETPAWSVGALLDMMPEVVIEKDNVLEEYRINVLCQEQVKGGTILDACYNMMLWLSDNGYEKYFK